MMDGLEFFYYDNDVVLLARRCFLAMDVSVPRRRCTLRGALDSFLYTVYDLDRAASASAGAAAVQG